MCRFLSFPGEKNNSLISLDFSGSPRLIGHFDDVLTSVLIPMISPLPAEHEWRVNSAYCKGSERQINDILLLNK